MHLPYLHCKSPELLDKFDLDSKLYKGDQLFKFIGKFRYLGMEDLPQEFYIDNCSTYVKFLDNKTGEITGILAIYNTN